MRKEAAYYEHVIGTSIAHHIFDVSMYAAFARAASHTRRIAHR